MEAYMDNSATTSCSKVVCHRMAELLCEEYGNPSSMHEKGLAAENCIKEAQEMIAKTLKVKAGEIFFTSGGTESNNMAILGTVMANQRRGKHIITTCIEHSSIANPMKFLEEQGYEVTYLSVDSNGILSLEELKNALREDTILVSIMHVNNEMGAVEPIEEAARIIKEYNSAIVFHVDGIQSYGKYKIYPGKWGIDLLSVSGHKIHGPKGVGFLYIREKTKIKPIIHGGGQQKGMRSGTENVPGIVGLGLAAEECYRDFETKIQHLYDLKEAFIQGVTRIEGVTVNGKTGRDSAPHIVSISVEKVRSEVLLHALEEKQIYISAGSACSSNTKKKVSATLKNIGVRADLLESTVRFSFSVNTTMEEIQYVLLELPEIIAFRRKYTRH